MVYILYSKNRDIPATSSDTATLLRLSPSYQFYSH